MQSIQGKPIYEKHRPVTFKQVAGQAAAVKQIRHAIDQFGWGGQSWWITGPSGSGKTTLAKIIAAQGACDFCVEEMDASRLTPAALSEIEHNQNLYGYPPGGRCWIINEAHGLRRSEVLRQLLVMLERLPAHVCWIFTTTDAGEQLLLDDRIDADPLLSRCHQVRLSVNREAFARLLRRVAQAEGLDGKPLAAYRGVIDRCNGNLRMGLSELAGGVAHRETRRRTSSAARTCGNPACDKAIRASRKYCGTECFFAALRAGKENRNG